MANVGIGIARTLIDEDGDSIIDASANALKVKLVDSDDIDIGNVVLQTAGGADVFTSAASSVIVPDLDGQQLLATHALLSARSDSSTTLGITCLDGTHNALHVAISDGTNTLSISDHSETVVATGIGIMGEAKVIDGSAFPNSVAEGEAVRFASTRNGILYVNLVDHGGLRSAIETDDSPQEATPAMINVGGEYRASPTTYADGDATILQSDINGHLKIAGIHIDDAPFSLGSDMGVMMMGFAGTQSVGANDAAALACTVAGQLEVTSTGTTIATFPQFDVDTSALQLTHSDALDTAGVTTTAKEIIIQCGFTNTGYIVVGDAALVAAEGVDSMDGIRLEAGDTLTLAATTTANIYVRGSANDQLVNVMIIS